MVPELLKSCKLYVQNGAKVMNDSEDIEFRDACKHWVERIDHHQYQIFVETAKIVKMLKQKNVSAKTKNEMIIVV